MSQYQPSRKRTDNGGRRKQVKETKRKNRTVLYGLGALGSLGLIVFVVATVLPGLNAKKPAPVSPLVVKSVPKNVSGLAINIPGANTAKTNLCVTPYNADMSKALASDCESKPVLSVPVVGPCPVLADGTIDADPDWTTACRHDFKLKNGQNGGVAFLSHSVHGSITGALEHIDRLKVGDVVEVGTVKYQVALVSKFPTNGLPIRLAEKGHVSLITCFMPGDTTADEVTQDIVVELTDYKPSAA